MFLKHASYIRYFLKKNKTLKISLIGYVFVFVSVLLLLFSKNNNQSLVKIRISVMDFFSPIIETVYYPVSFSKDILSGILDRFLLYEELLMLRNENKRLYCIEKNFYRLKSENILLKKIVNLSTENKYLFVTARVLSNVSKNYFINNLIINVGKKQKVKKYQPVIIHNRLIGRILEVGNLSSQVLLISDRNSYIPVILKRSRAQGIVIGGDFNEFFLKYVKEYKIVKINEVILTSGQGGIYPPGLVIGFVEIISEDKITVKPIINWSKLDIVQVILTDSLSFV